MDKTINISGKASLKVHPDQIELEITLQDVAKEYRQAVEKSAVQTNKLKKAIVGCGFKETDLKTTGFRVNAEYSQKNNKSVLTGYRFVHETNLIFKLDNDRLDAVINALSQSGVAATFSINYTLHNPDQAKDQLLTQAVADAHQKAEVLAKAAGVKLGEISRIDYDVAEHDMMRSPFARMNLMETASFSSKAIEPEDIELSDNVTMTWLIAGQK